MTGGDDGLTIGAAERGLNDRFLQELEIRHASPRLGLSHAERAG